MPSHLQIRSYPDDPQSPNLKVGFLDLPNLILPGDEKMQPQIIGGYQIIGRYGTGSEVELQLDYYMHERFGSKHNTDKLIQNGEVTTLEPARLTVCFDKKTERFVLHLYRLWNSS